MARRTLQPSNATSKSNFNYQHLWKLMMALIFKALILCFVQGLFILRTLFVAFISP